MQLTSPTYLRRISINKYITKLADAGIVKGRSTTQYAPNANLSRAELATLLVNLKKLPLETSKQYFNDVKPGTWYYGYVNAAAKAGLVAGYGDGTYRPNNPVTRAELAVVGLRGLGVTQATIDQYAKNPIYLSSDESKYTNYWAKGWLTAAIMPRYQVLSWRQPGKLIAADKAATRGEAAYTIYKAKVACKKRRTAVRYRRPGTCHVVLFSRRDGCYETSFRICHGSRTRFRLEAKLVARNGTLGTHH